MVPLVRAAGRLAAVDIGAFAIIGGVAVTVRLGRAHRATADVDTVVDDDTPPAAIDVLRHLDGVTLDPVPHRIYVDDTKVELISTGSIAAADLDGLDDRQALFVASHRWALETATPVTLSCDGGEQATVPVARPGALVAMKVHAIQERRPHAGLDKRAGDAWDIYRLITDIGPAPIASELRSALPRLRALVTEAASQVLVERAGRTRGWLRAGDDAMASVEVEDLVAAGTDLLAHLSADG